MTLNTEYTNKVSFQKKRALNEAIKNIEVEIEKHKHNVTIHTHEFGINEMLIPIAKGWNKSAGFGESFPEVGTGLNRTLKVVDNKTNKAITLLVIPYDNKIGIKAQSIYEDTYQSVTVTMSHGNVIGTSLVRLIEATILASIGDHFDNH